MAYVRHASIYEAPAFWDQASEDVISSTLETQTAAASAEAASTAAVAADAGVPSPVVLPDVAPSTVAPAVDMPTPAKAGTNYKPLLIGAGIVAGLWLLFGGK